MKGQIARRLWLQWWIALPGQDQRRPGVLASCLKCSKCGYVANIKGGLAAHKRAAHAKERR